MCATKSHAHPHAVRTTCGPIRIPTRFVKARLLEVHHSGPFECCTYSIYPNVYSIRARPHIARTAFGPIRMYHVQTSTSPDFFLSHNAQGALRGELCCNGCWVQGIMFTKFGHEQQNRGEEKQRQGTKTSSSGFGSTLNFVLEECDVACILLPVSVDIKNCHIISFVLCHHSAAFRRYWYQTRGSNKR